MPASNIETIYQFESALESCIETILQTDASLTCYKQKDTDIKASPWAEVQCTGVSANGKQYKTGTNGFNWPIDFTSTVQVTVTTNREQNTSSHAAYLGKVRRYLYDLSSYTTQRLPYLAVSLVSESGSSAVFVEDERFDSTVLQFRVNFFIRSDAWPQEEEEGWTPASIAGLQLWLDASQITGLNDGDAVSTWSDLSGNANNGTQSTASKRPTYQTAEQNGLPGVLGDGIDDVLDFPNAVVPASNFTLYLVARQQSAPSLARLIGNCTTSSADGFILITGSSEGPRYWILRNSGGGGADISMSPIPGLATTYTFRLVMGASVTTAYVNNGSRGTSTCVALGVSGQNLQLFNDGGPTGGTFSNNLFFEVLVYNSAHDAATQALVEAYLNAKWAAY